MAAFQKILIPPTKESKEEYGDPVQRSISMFSQVQAIELEKNNERNPTVSEYEQLLHPNEETSEISHAISHFAGAAGQMPKSWATSSFVNWFIRFDENKLRPFLIRNYSAGKAELED